MDNWILAFGGHQFESNGIMNEILMPVLFPEMEEGTLSRWFVAIGDRVLPGDLVAEVETDKATVEIEAQVAGIVEALLVPEGADSVKINTPIARLGD